MKPHKYVVFTYHNVFKHKTTPSIEESFPVSSESPRHGGESLTHIPEHFGAHTLGKALVESMVISMGSFMSMWFDTNMN